VCGGAAGEQCVFGHKTFCFACSQKRPATGADLLQARDAALAMLDSAARALPGDRWIAGQFSFLLGKSGAWQRARDAARSCRVTVPEGWCGMLGMHAEARAGDGARAEATLDSVLASLTPEGQCAWGNVAVLIESDSLRKAYATLPCTERLSFERRFWWLSDPSYLLKGNDRRTTHAARMVEAALDEDWRTGAVRSLEAAHNRDAIASQGIVTGTVRDTIIAMGPYDAWTIQAQVPGVVASRDASGRQAITTITVNASNARTLSRVADARYAFVPKTVAITSPFAATADAWTAMRSDSSDAARFGSGAATRRSASSPPQERATPPYAPVVSLTAYQVARFPRADSQVVVAAIDIDADPEERQVMLRPGAGPGPDEARAALILTAGPGASQRWDSIAPANRSSPIVLAAIAPGIAVVASLELLGPSQHGLVRSRFGLPTVESAGRLRVSDLLLYDPASVVGAAPGAALRGDPTTATSQTSPAVSSRLSEIAPAAFGRTRFGAATASIGIFWEMGGVQTGDTVAAVLSVDQLNERGVLARLGDRIGVGQGPTSPVSLSWSEQVVANATPGVRGQRLDARNGDVVGRALIVSLQSLQPGRYAISLVVQVAGEQPARATREITIIR
jgi:hypothetical protein